MKSFRSIIIGLLSGGILGIGMSIFLPYTSAYLSGIGFTNSEIGYINAFGPLLGIFIAPVIGHLSDIIGRKIITLSSLLFQIIALYFLLTLNDNFIIAAFIMATITLTHMMVEIMVISRIEDNVDDSIRGKFTGLFESLKNIGRIVGPIVGSFIVLQSSINVTFKAGIIFVLILLSLHLLTRDMPVKAKPKLRDLNILKDFKHFYSHKGLRSLGALGFFINLAQFSMLVFLPLFILQELGGSVAIIGVIIALGHFFHLFQYFFGLLDDKYGSERFIIIGVLIQALAYIMIFATPNLYILGFAMLIFSLGAGAWNTSAIVYMSKLGEKEKREGETMGSYASIANMGIFTGFIASGFLVSITGIRSLFLVFGLLILVSLIISFRPLLKHGLKSLVNYN